MMEVVLGCETKNRYHIFDNQVPPISIQYPGSANQYSVCSWFTSRQLLASMMQHSQETRRSSIVMLDPPRANYTP